MTSERDSTPIPCRVDGCIIGYSYLLGSCALACLLTYTVAKGYKTSNISETVEDRAKITINGLYKVIHWLSIAAKITSERDSRSLIP